MKSIVTCVVVALLATTGTAYANMTDAELRTLADLSARRALEVLGPPPTDGPYRGHVDTGTQRVPPPGCRNPEAVSDRYDPVTNRTFVRWRCAGPMPRH